MKVLGVFLGNESFQKKNWEGLAEKVSARLSRWKWVQPQLSYRGRTLVANNLVASMLWHRVTVLVPPDILITEIQKRLVDFFWGGYHWVRSAVLFLPVSEGGQGLIDLRSRITAFRLQTVQHFLYGTKKPWTDTASLLLRGVRNLAYDKHLFLLELDGVDISQTSVFYQSVLRAWRTVLKVRRDFSHFYGTVGEEPLFHNPAIRSRILSSGSVQRILTGLTKLAGLRSAGQWKTAASLCQDTGFKSLRLMDKLVEEVVSRLPGYFRRALGAELEEDNLLRFPELSIRAAVEEQDEADGFLLSFRTPGLLNLSATSKKSLYAVSVKVLNRAMLAGVRESRWLDVLAPGSSPRGSWRSLYKPPIEKRCADLQWRVVHGAVATNRHVAHIDHRAGIACWTREDRTWTHGLPTEPELGPGDAIVPVGLEFSVEECGLAAGEVVGCDSIKALSRMNSDDALERELSLHGQLVSAIKMMLWGGVVHQPQGGAVERARESRASSVLDPGERRPEHTGRRPEPELGPRRRQCQCGKVDATGFGR
ncbi:Transposon TX1 uncharacterized protein [Merluccius polli]|uniref:Transposon TX1 uncharacterized protein n=1 Tax=Merluccius polli TaxID=89951 RepID=A0AA47P8V8_MERPO|nr:Transposon TX1 uncharacterized protein [Merluccius polli]